MANYEPKTCIKCKYRSPKIKRFFDGSEKLLYLCYEHRKYRADLGGYIPDIWDVSGRHWKCEKYERRKE